MPSLLEIVGRNLNDARIGTRAGFLVQAALLGDDELHRTLDEGEVPADVVAAVTSDTMPASVYLRAIRVSGFRGIGPEATLELEPGPGLTLVVGRNGSGKSSFAEAVEFAFTGRNRRWDSRSVIWKEGWRNLHHPGDTRIEIDLAVEGKRDVTVLVRRWNEHASLDDHDTWVQPLGTRRSSLDAMGWRDHLTWFRPFLPYTELGAMLDEGPTSLYDAMSAMLGLDLLVDAQSRLRRERLERNRATDAARQELGRIREQLATMEDERARRALTATAGQWDLDVLTMIVTGEGLDEADGSAIVVLRRLATIQSPDIEDVTSASLALRAAAAAIDELRGTNSAEAWQLADLLDKALSIHAEHVPRLCPVCGEGRLDDTWREHAQGEVERLRKLASAADHAHREAVRARDAALDLLTGAPPEILRSHEVEIDTGELRAAFQAWNDGRRHRDQLLALADHLEDWALPLMEKVQAVRDQATRQLDKRESAWRPISTQIAGWLERGRRALQYSQDVSDLHAAERWLKRTTEAIRDERFQPIAQSCQAIWEVLRLRSNIELGRVALEGSSTRRRVTLDVTVDNVPGAALGVMSQGELHALALSLFLPRATMENSAFRFVVIDDPVQSMDPARVDGLARVLEKTAQTRQVSVFTHDDRLPDSVRRLAIPARIIEVTRGPDSEISLRSYLDPVERYIDDARAVASTEGLPDELGEAVVPGLCRLALEAACAEAVRRRRLQRGDAHRDIEGVLRAADRLTSLAALALFDDATRGGEVLGRLNRLGRWAGDVFQACNRGMHRGYEGDLHRLIGHSQDLANHLRRLT